MNTTATSRLRLSQRVMALLALLTMAGAVQGHHADLPEGITPVQATWLWGHYVVPDSITKDGSPYVYAYPHEDPDRIVNPPWTEVAAGHIKPGAKAPAVLFLHGCSGLIRGGMGYRILLMSEGYAIFEPDAFARPGYSCARSSLAMRREELAYALAQIRQLSWVDKDRIVLMGNSQGGKTVALWNEPGFAAHVIVAANCVSLDVVDGRSPRAPRGVPVLAVVGSEDARYGMPNCQVNRKVGGSRSIVISGAGHDIMGHAALKQALKAFLRECCQ